MPSEDEEEFRDTQEEVREVLGKAISCLPEIINLDPEPRQVDLDEEASITSFMSTTCGCHGRQAYGPCSARFTSTHVLCPGIVL